MYNKMLNSFEDARDNDDSGNKALPEGLGFSMAMNKDAMKNFSNMTEEQQRKVITESKLMQSKDEMSQLVDRLATNSFQ